VVIEQGRISRIEIRTAHHSKATLGVVVGALETGFGPEFDESAVGAGALGGALLGGTIGGLIGAHSHHST
jgi:hypothetical protein